MRARSNIQCALVAAVLLGTGACAGGGALRLQEATPASIAELEAQRRSRPQDLDLITRLGVAYFRADRHGDARSTFEHVLARDRNRGIAAIYLGMAAEAQGEFAAARDAYERYIAVSRDRELRNTARQRLALVERRRLEFEARRALAREAELSTAAPEPNTIAVMPFSYAGANEEVRPLGRGFAQLVVTDLAKSRQVRVLERERMQAMVDEMRLTEEGRADPASAVRSGRLLRASRVVQGSLADIGDALRVDAAVVDVNTAGIAAAAGGTDELSRLFDLQKRLVFSIFDNLGIQLSDAEREAINRRPTGNLQAFLAFSRGLEAGDRGDFAAAAGFFNEATRLDPAFSVAQASAAEATGLSAASAQTVAEVDATVVQRERVERGGAGEETRREALREAVNSVAPTTAIRQEAERERTATEPPRNRDTTAESTGTEGPAPTIGRVVIVIKRPQ